VRPRLLDLFCGAGGCSVGYNRAGFDVVGVDIQPQPNYPYEFHQADALTFPLSGFDAIHASPPCQAYSTVSGRALKGKPRRYPDLIAPVRDRLAATGAPYVIENVVGAPLRDAAQLCGSAFGLDLHRHRRFESNAAILSTPCSHHWQEPRYRSLDSRRAGKLATVVGVHGHLNYSGELELRERAMGIDWMTHGELVEAIPPAYTEHIGGYLLAEVTARV
jgi:DNA (cytosine-5)-methyltransferase 1